MMCNIMILLFCSDRYLMVKSPFVGASLLCFLCMVNLPSSPIMVLLASVNGNWRKALTDYTQEM